MKLQLFQEQLKKELQNHKIFASLVLTVWQVQVKVSVLILEMILIWVKSQICRVRKNKPL